VLERVRRRALEAYSHQDLPFEALVEAIQPQRDLSHTPLFQVMFTMDPPSVPEFQLPELSWTSVGVQSGAAVFDLTLCMRDHPEGLSGYFEYNSDLFDEATVARMAGHYRRLLEGFVANPEDLIDAAELLTDAEKQDILSGWNAAVMETPTDRCVHELIEARAKERPEAVSLLFEDQVLSYGELNRRANQLAHYLLKLGVGPEALVGICTERGTEMIIAILGILKAGGAYLPLDPAYPPERLNYMIEDSGVKVILTQEKLRTECSEFSVQGSEDRGQPTSRRGGQSDRNSEGTGPFLSDIGGRPPSFHDLALGETPPPSGFCEGSGEPRK
jgi:non-ribosomal peptide synthetase component F